ncbi:hypothetical protein DPMN_021581 [Dreissena polymorpha]|uniref:Uncharacterized protein n=1 Tax=Dreissena polymorpha TaxID=45954 RepID=A0A9D4NIU1_DREPO|nr:hypothetical protein DPMN_021581 [Dreissena polymorpha]
MVIGKRSLFPCALSPWLLDGAHYLSVHCRHSCWKKSTIAHALSSWLLDEVHHLSVHCHHGYWKESTIALCTVTMCDLILPFCVKLLKQTGHWNGFSPVCVRMWSSRWPRRLNDRPQIRHAFLAEINETIL